MHQDIRILSVMGIVYVFSLHLHELAAATCKIMKVFRHPIIIQFFLGEIIRND